MARTAPRLPVLLVALGLAGALAFFVARALVPAETEAASGTANEEDTTEASPVEVDAARDAAPVDLEANEPDAAAPSSTPEPAPPKPALVVWVVDDAGQPIQHTVVSPEPRFARTRFTDAEGRATFEGLSTKVAELLVAANGFVRRRVKLEAHEGELHVALVPSAKLQIELSTPEGVDPMSLAINLYRLRAPSPNRDGSWVLFERRDVGRHGEAEFVDVPTNRRLWIDVVCSFDGPGLRLELDPLVDGETRVVPLTLADPGRFINGLLVNESGDLLPGRLEQLGRWRRWEDADRQLLRQLHSADPDRQHAEDTHRPTAWASEGRFLVGPLFYETMDFVVLADGHAPRVVNGYPLTGRRDLGAATTFVLEPGAEVTATLDNGLGFVDPWKVQVLHEGANLPVNRQLEDDRIVFAELPLGELTFRFPFAGGFASVERAAGADEVRLSRPELGFLRVLGSAPVRVELFRTSDASPHQQVVDTERIVEVLPGSYRVELRRCLRKGIPVTGAVHWTYEATDVMATRRVLVRAGETIDLAAP